MQSNTRDEMVDQFQHLSLAEQLDLLERLIEVLQQQTKGTQPHTIKGESEPLYDVRDFRGIGHGTWTEAGGIDEFIKQERASWDG